MSPLLLPGVVALALAVVVWLLLRRASPTMRIVAALSIFAAALSISSFLPPTNDGGSPGTDEAGASVPNSVPNSLSQLAENHPQQVPGNGYLSSSACRECHPDNHSTWAASYHRRMTQLATPEAVIGDFDDTELELAGSRYQFRRHDELCWVEMDRPDGSAGRVELPIVMTTGSHHLQVYWYPTGEGRVVRQLPFVYLKEADRWIPRDSSFLQPPEAFGAQTGNWNQSCINCHTTHGQPRPDGQGNWDSQVGEFGISCEACHGPGEEHVAMHRRSSVVDPADDPIVNPVDLSNKKSTQVCGQCHGFTLDLNDEVYTDAMLHGRAYRPGDELSETRHVLQTNDASREFLAEHLGEHVEEYLLGQFWPDGVVRITGREYNGLIDTACFQEGELSCVSCHTLHQKDSERTAQEWADDQLQVGMRGDKACVQCHDAADYGASHTHHADTSSGSRCYNCHMPHTTYGLLKAIRSHKITSPSVAVELEAGRPNACNLCHLDKTLDWTAGHLAEWYGRLRPELNDDQQNVAASLLTLLRGDAGQRALLSWHMSWPPAVEASGNDWQAPFLACLLEDPYDAVRFMTHESLRNLPGFADFDYDFVGPEIGRADARARALQLWAGQGGASNRSPALLMKTDSGIDFALLNRLLSERDDRPVNLAE